MFCSGCACVCSPLRFLKALSFASLDKEDLLSPINYSTLHRSSSVRSMVSSATFGCSEDYIGLALPLDINNMFQVHFVVSSPCNASVESGVDLTDRRGKRPLRVPGNRETYLANAPVCICVMESVKCSFTTQNGEFLSGAEFCKLVNPLIITR